MFKLLSFNCHRVLKSFKETIRKSISKKAATTCQTNTGWPAFRTKKYFLIKNIEDLIDEWKGELWTNYEFARNKTGEIDMCVEKLECVHHIPNYIEKTLTQLNVINQNSIKNSLISDEDTSQDTMYERIKSLLFII